MKTELKTKLLHIHIHILNLFIPQCGEGIMSLSRFILKPQLFNWGLGKNWNYVGETIIMFQKYVQTKFEENKWKLEKIFLQFQ